MTRVLMLLENNPYPQDGRVRREATSLARAGYRVSVISPAAPGQRRREDLGGVQVYRYPRPPVASGLVGYALEYGYSLIATAFLSLYVALTRGFDIIHAHNPPDSVVLLGGVFKLFGKRFVFDHHDLAPEMYRARFGAGASNAVYRALRFFERLSFRLADHVITTNGSYREIALSRGKVPEARVTVVRNGPDPRRVRLVPPDDELRRIAPTIIGYVGVMGPQDGLEYFVRALYELKAERQDFCAVMIGSGDALADVRRLTEELSLSEHVLFTGHVDDAAELMRYLSSIDIGVDPAPSNPYNDRSTAIKLGEYLALGKPVVAFDLPEHRVTAGPAAVYATPNSAADFARKISELMDDPIRRKEMGEEGRSRVESHLSWPLQEQRLLEVYAALG